MNEIDARIEQLKADMERSEAEIAARKVTVKSYKREIKKLENLREQLADILE